MSRPDHIELPAYFRHRGTGVMVEIDRAGLLTFGPDGPGNFRPYNHMTCGAGDCWSSMDEINILRKASGWRHERPE